MARGAALVRCIFLLIVMYSMTMTILLLTNSPSPQTCLTPGDGGDTDTMRNVRRVPPNGGDVDSGHNPAIDKGANVNGVIDREPGDDPSWGRHKLAVIVPYRDRLEELLEFAPHLHRYLVKKKVRHAIYIINQVDTLRFNRGSLINVGVREMAADCDYIAMHDVDLLPLNEELDYSYPYEGVYHLAAPHLHPLYHYKTFIGGILLLTKNHFETVNGMSNRYWGWGREDDELYVRLKKAGLLKYKWVEHKGIKEIEYSVRRPENITTGNHTFRHLHDKRNRPRDNSRYFDQHKKTSRLDRETGMSTVQYTVTKRHSLVINSGPVTLLEVKLSCDFEKTPWCLYKRDHYLLLQTPKPPDMNAPRKVS